MNAEGNETPGGDAGGSAEGRGRRSEGDLLAERRARRAAETGEHALTLRAEAAEATVRTLETHVASLQQRLSDSEQESRRIADLLDAERAPRASERPELIRRAQAPPPDSELERELQRASQREYAEQRLRVEAEDRSAEAQRESRAEIERVRRRLASSERETETLGARLELVERELAEAEQAAATERSAMVRTERALRSRVGELEGTALEMHRALEAERGARRRAEYLLDALRDAQRAALGLLGGLADTIARLREASASAVATAPLSAAPDQPPPAQPEAPRPPIPLPEQRPAAALPAAQAPVQRPLGTGAPEPAARQPPSPEDPRSDQMAEALAAAVVRLRARVDEQATPPAAPRASKPPHKHSMSLIKRTRLAFRRRRERRKERRAG